MDDKSGHRERLREKFLNQGIEGFYHPYEKLEFLLTFSIPQKDVKPIAKELLSKFKTIEGVLKASVEQLKSVDGIGEKTALFLKYISDLNKELFKIHYKAEKISISSKNDLIGYLKNEIGFDDRENFFILYLDSANHLINERELKSESLFKGTIDRSAIYPREIAVKIMGVREENRKEKIIKNKEKRKGKGLTLEDVTDEKNGYKNIVEKSIDYKAKSVIISHNHPSGNYKPSRSDIELTQTLKSTLGMLDIRLIDHIIVTKESYFSFLEEGLLE